MRGPLEKVIIFFSGLTNFIKNPSPMSATTYSSGVFERVFSLLQGHNGHSSLSNNPLIHCKFVKDVYLQDKIVQLTEHLIIQLNFNSTGALCILHHSCMNGCLWELLRFIPFSIILTIIWLLCPWDYFVMLSSSEVIARFCTFLFLLFCG